MRNLKRAFWGAVFLFILLWLFAEPAIFRSNTFFGVRGALVQLTGIVAIGCMSLSMILALRPRWPEAWLGGLDKMYRLHKWLGIASLVVAVGHWLWAIGPKWAVRWGWLERPARGSRSAIENPIAQALSGQRDVAETVGEWAFYAVVALVALALIQKFPYRVFFKTHRLLAIAYLLLAYHTVVLMRFKYWTSPVGWLTGVLLTYGTWAAVVVLLRRVGARRQVWGTISKLQYFSGVRSIEAEIDVPNWAGHKPGQFAFVTSSPSEGAHPYTIASSWRDETPKITFIAKELGDYTRHLHERLQIGQKVKIEGPYGCFTFNDDRAHQIWVGGGIGITPFIARMRHRATQQEIGDAGSFPTVDLFHCTADTDEEAFSKLAAVAKSADVRLHLLIDSCDGLLSGERLRAAVPTWRDASIWFCGPIDFGEALQRDLAENGFSVHKHFHQELFSMR